jgi:hypothetical protein
MDRAILPRRHALPNDNDVVPFMEVSHFLGNSWQLGEKPLPERPGFFKNHFSGARLSLIEIYTSKS